MKTGKDSAGYRDEKGRYKMSFPEICPEIKTVQRPWLPDFNHGKSFDKHHDEEAGSRKDQNRSENGIDFSDDFVNGKNRCYKVINKYKSIELSCLS